MRNFSVMAIREASLFRFGLELGVGFLEKFALGPKLGESFLHGLAGCVGVQLGFLLHSCGLGLGPLPMHV